MGTATDLTSFGDLASIPASDLENLTITHPDRDFFEVTTGAAESGLYSFTMTLPRLSGSNATCSNLGLRVRDASGHILSNTGAWNQTYEEFVLVDLEPSTTYFIEVYSGSFGQVNAYDLDIELVSGEISGFKFLDENFDSTWNADEPGLAGWTITLSDGVTDRTTTTDSNGFYSFTIDQADFGKDYTVSETLQGVFFQTLPGNQVTEPYSVTVDDWNRTVDHLDFGNAEFSAIHGFKFHDVDGDQVYTAGTDSPMEGITFTLTGIDGQDNVVTLTTATDSEGEFWFTGLRPSVAGANGTGYTVSETQPSPVWVSVTGGPQTLDLKSGEELAWTTGAAMNPAKEVVVEELIFGNAVSGSIHGFKFDDRDANGIYEAGVDAPKEGIEFQLFASPSKLLSEIDLPDGANPDIVDVQLGVGDPLTFEVTLTQNSIGNALDLVFLEDLSASFGNDLSTINGPCWTD